MSGYTPTTREIRDDYALLADASRPRHMQFDRWLESTLQETQIAERERIIQLLEEEADICYGLGFRPGKRLLDVIIDRIKGENK